MIVPERVSSTFRLIVGL